MDSLQLNKFAPINLAELDSTAGLMTRRDKKYILHSSLVSQLLKQAQDYYSILEIDGIRSFGYNSTYYDSPCLSTYKSHHQMRRRRFKVRRRQYLDSGINKFELKYKSTRSQTIKKRIDSPSGFFERLRSEEIGFIEHHLDEYLRQGMPRLDSFQNVIDVFYKRITLVSKDGGERVTLDSQLKFSNKKQHKELDPNTWIIESKSSNGRGFADRLIKSLGQRPTKHCSKYCVALASLDNVEKKNQFAGALRNLERVAATHPTRILK